MSDLVVGFTVGFVVMYVWAGLSVCAATHVTLEKNWYTTPLVALFWWIMPIEVLKRLAKRGNDGLE